MVTFGDPRLSLRFWSKILVVEPTGCWMWQRATQKGYGAMKVPNEKRMVRTHRLAYETLVGPISAGLHIDHLCKVRRCCNPTHLEPVTPAENVRRSDAYKNSRLAQLAKTHCPHGHPYDEANTRNITKRDGSKERHCRTCSNFYSTRYKQRKAQESK